MVSAHAALVFLKGHIKLPVQLVLDRPVAAHRRVPGGTDRKTHKMVRLDLAAARKKWGADAKEPGERACREASDFLRHRDQAGRFADFHGVRHFFITSLERAGISPKMAQTLARHSDIRLTLGVYTHVELGDRVAAIGALAGPG